MTAKPLGPPDSHYVEAARGWVELGNATEAVAELACIAPALQSHPEVLDARWHICAHTKRWDECVNLASLILEAAPEQSSGWILRSFALHERKRTAEAFDLLLPAASKFPSLWLVPYNLACYSAQLRRFKDAEKWFTKALTIDAEAVKQSAHDDPDLWPLWEYLGGKPWGTGA
jgi:tetratricopeptide (TPR) repeat protein